MTTTRQVIDRTLGHLLRGRREQRNRLATTVNNVETTYVFTYDLGGITPGARVSIGLEDHWVWATTPASKSATVQRGDGGSTPAIHTASDLVQVNPQYSRYDVVLAVNEELGDLSSPVNGLFQLLAIDLTYDSAVRGYDLAGVTSFLDVYELRWKSTDTTSKRWPLIRTWNISRKMAAAEFASGTAIFIPGAEHGQTIRLRYKAGFTALSTTDETQVVETVSGLHAEAVDILSLGAALRLAAGRPIPRAASNVQGDTRRGEEATTGDMVTSMAAIRALRQTRIQAEAARLAQAYPEGL